MYCDRCPARAHGTLLLPSGGVLDLCGHHLRVATGALDNRGDTYEVIYRTATV